MLFFKRSAFICFVCLAGHAIAAFVLPTLNITTFPFANESKTKARAAISFHNHNHGYFSTHFGNLKMGTQWCSPAACCPSSLQQQWAQHSFLHTHHSVLLVGYSQWGREGKWLSWGSSGSTIWFCYEPKAAFMGEACKLRITTYIFPCDSGISNERRGDDPPAQLMRSDGWNLYHCE